MDIEKNLDTFKNIFKQVLSGYFLPDDNLEPKIDIVQGFIPLQNKNAYISLSGDYYGYLIITASEESRLNILTNLSTLLGLPFERLKKIGANVLNEILNQVSGNLTAYIKSEKIKINITIPFVIQGNELQIYSANSNIYSFTYYSNNLPVVFYVDMAAHHTII